MLWLDIKFSKLIGGSLERFSIKKNSPFTASARCPVCGDSAKSKTKTRFIFYEKNSEINVFCHNCSFSTTILGFLKGHYPALYQEYVFERFADSDSTPVVTEKPFTKKTEKIQSLDLVSVSSLEKNHRARVYIESRKIPPFDFKFTETFNKFSSKYVPELAKSKTDHARIIIEYKTRSGKVFCYQGRAIDGHPEKYKTIVLPGYEEAPKIFGIDRLNFSKEVFIVEGPIDSLFLENSVAVSNVNLLSGAEKFLKTINSTRKENIILILDNEPRNKQVLEQYEKAIEAGYRIVIWPSEIEEKDINEMSLAGHDPQQIIRANTHSGLLALHHFNSWKRI